MDTSNLTNLINALRAETAANAITPESLGALLQLIVDALATASPITGSPIITLQQGSSDRNHVYLTAHFSNNGAELTTTDYVQIQQATTDRAGAMRAQQVTDLNNVRNSMNTVQQQIATIQQQIASLEIGDVPVASDSSNGLMSKQDYNLLRELDERSANNVYSIEYLANAIGLVLFEADQELVFSDNEPSSDMFVANGTTYQQDCHALVNGQVLTVGYRIDSNSNISFFSVTDFDIVIVCNDNDSYKDVKVTKLGGTEHIVESGVTYSLNAGSYSISKQLQDCNILYVGIKYRE